MIPLPQATVIAPAYNEEAALPAVLAALEPLIERGVDVIVVDDGSTDRTAAVAREAGVRLVRLERNAGKAAAVRAGLAVARTDKVVVIDADATYPVNAIPAILRLLDDHDVVLGVRTEGRDHIPSLNRIGNGALRTAIHWFSGFRSADPLTGLYGIRREHLEAMNLQSRGFGLEAEICVKSARMGLRWADLPITYAERIGESKLNPVRDGIVITWTIIRTLFGGPRLRPARGRLGTLRPAPLAMAATIVSIALLTMGVIATVALLGLSLATIVSPTVPLATAGALPAVLLLLAGVVLWRIVTRWGRPGPRLLAPTAVAGVGLGAGLMILGLVATKTMGIAPSNERVALLMGVLLILSTVVLATSPAAWPLALRGPAIRDRLSAGVAVLVAPSWRGEAIVLGAAILLIAIAVLRYLLLQPIFGFDESIYANTSRHVLLGTPNTGWSQHRSPGISVLGLFAVPFASELAFRLVGLASGIGVVVAGWQLARLLGGVGAGRLAALVLATIPALVFQSGFFLTDVPSAAIVIAFMVVAWNELEEKPRPTAGLMWLAPIAAAAFYVRYGASVPVLAVAVTCMLLWHRKLISAWRPAAATLGILFLLLTPHLVQATLTTGSPLGIASMAQRLAAPAYPGEALRLYIALLPGQLSGIIGDALLLLGIVAWPVLLFRHRLRDRIGRAHAFLLVPALAQFVLLGMTSLPQVRYVLLPIVLTILAGVIVAVRMTRRLAQPSRQALAVAIAVGAIVVGLPFSALQLQRTAAGARTQDEIINLARVIADDADGESCAVLAYPPPQLTWYSGCRVDHYGYPPIVGQERLLDGEREYLVLFIGRYDRYPTDSTAEYYRRLAEQEPFAVVSDAGSGQPMFEVYRMRER